MLAMTFVAVAALLYLAQASQASVLEFNIADQQSQQIQLTAQNASLQSTAIALQSLQRVDQIATTQLHMTKPDPSSAIWVRPVIPNVVAIRPLNADTLSAQRQSEPLAWMARVITRIKSVL
jgi:cell division protein FtsL